MGKRVVIAGIDGGEYYVFEQMFRKGLMPNLQAIMKRGHCLSLDGYVKGPGQGWASFMTGKTPEKHGVYYWSLYNQMVNSKFIKDKFLWELLGENGIKSCVINMPYTYPPRPFNGYLISGLGSGLSAADVSDYSYPKSLLKEIKQNIGGYVVGCEYKDGSTEDHKKLVQDIIQMTEYRTKACLYIMEKYSPEFVCLVYRGADLIQHCYWNLLKQDYKNSSQNQPVKDLIHTYYKELDESVAQIFEKYNDSINFIISDHGFGPARAIVYLNHYLADKGLLVKIKAGSSRKQYNPLLLGRTALKYIFLKTLKDIRFFRSLNKIRKNISGSEGLPMVSDQTKAYSDVLYGVNLNKALVPIQDLPLLKQKVIDELYNLNDPVTGDSVIKKACLKEESYAKDVKGAPDIIFEPSEEYHVTFETKLNTNEVFRFMEQEETVFFTGIHKKMGVCIVDGKNLSTPKNAETIITDIHATVLNIFKVAKPPEIDGENIFK